LFRRFLRFLFWASPPPSSIFLFSFIIQPVLFQKWNWLSVLTVCKAKGLEWEAYNGRTNLCQKKELVFYSS
jgi:hypothetical protein